MKHTQTRFSESGYTYRVGLICYRSLININELSKRLITFRWLLIAGSGNCRKYCTTRKRKIKSFNGFIYSRISVSLVDHRVRIYSNIFTRTNPSMVFKLTSRKSVACSFLGAPWGSETLQRWGKKHLQAYKFTCFYYS